MHEKSKAAPAVPLLANRQRTATFSPPSGSYIPPGLYADRTVPLAHSLPPARCMPPSLKPRMPKCNKLHNKALVVAQIWARIRQQGAHDGRIPSAGVPRIARRFRLGIARASSSSPRSLWAEIAPQTARSPAPVVGFHIPDRRCGVAVVVVRQPAIAAPYPFRYNKLETSRLFLRRLRISG